MPIAMVMNWFTNHLIIIMPICGRHYLLVLVCMSKMMKLMMQTNRPPVSKHDFVLNVILVVEKNWRKYVKMEPFKVYNRGWHMLKYWKLVTEAGTK